MFTVETTDPLLEWFHTVKEPHFFRQNRTPYRVWVSEVALQQTRIQAALEPLKRFFKTYPNLSSLAQTSEEKVLQAWRGLGYYSRARNLRKGARYVMEHHRGKLPSTWAELQEIPSIGPYTASAIASICHGQPHPAVDGNLKRVFSRLQGWREPRNSPDLHRKTQLVLEEVMAEVDHHPGDMNEGLMELGQKICLPRNAKCNQCPIEEWCWAQEHNAVDEYPQPTAKKARLDVRWDAYIATDGKGKYLIQQWKDFYFLKGQWSFPSTLHFPKKEKTLYSWDTGRSSLHRRKASEIGPVKHGITKHRLKIYPQLVRPFSKVPSYFNRSPFRWVTQEEMSQVLVASALAKVWKKVLQAEERDRGGLF